MAIPDRLSGFDRYEGSIESALPVFLYRFQYRTEPDFIACYTNCEVPLTTSDGVLHLPEAIKHGKIPNGMDLDDDKFRVTLPILTEVVQRTNQGLPPEPIVVTIYKMHLDDARGQFRRI